MTATLDCEIGSEIDGSIEMVCNYSLPSEAVNNNAEKTPVMLDIYDDLFNEVMDELKIDFSSNFTSELGEIEQDQLSRKFKQFFDHSVFGGRLTRSRLSFAVYESLKPNSGKLELKKALSVLMSIELLQAVFLVVDDIMDSGETRRGKPCWYKMPGVGMGALNHALRLQNFVNLSIMKNIPDHKNLHLILRTMWETIQTTSDGQELDEVSGSSIDFCTFGRYSKIVANKTSRYTFYYPISIALLLADKTDHLPQALEISNALGYYFQAQDDYLDFLDNDQVTGKTSCDIREGKCTWFACKTIEKLKENPEKLKRFSECYGSSNPNLISEAHQIMLNCNLLEEFKEFEETTVSKLKLNISKFPVKEIRPALEFILKKLHGRKK